MPIEPIKSIFLTIQKMNHIFRTAYRDSKLIINGLNKNHSY